MKRIKDILGSNVMPSQTSCTNLISDTDQPYSLDKVKCPICDDRGIVLKGDIAYPCHCMQTKKLENQFRHARISRDLMKCRFDKFRFDFYSSELIDQNHRDGAVKALRAARGFVDECLQNPYGLGIVFTGPVGSGKTYLAACIANELMESDLKVLFIVVPDLLDELRATYKSELNELDLLDTARTIPILILDDLGAHNYTDWTRNRLYSIINYRLNEQLPTVITSNLSLDEMEDYIGLRTTSRIIQSSRIFRLTVQKDIRLQIYQEREGKK
ncbi:ATP-binding protein [Desulfosporosinus youngiae]|uniref:DNA replication protein n=1 Tax=Desulfosporosinus youngiae DSM 17734 TaxID=768710 RepID=H5Y4X8_9FIRM|nr:ATP-binding protein [Desulfosporosinus youngiae]EHQ90013.1 DNA replication protein [Desulfosporosinus youngiae DSM 17734]